MQGPVLGARAAEMDEAPRSVPWRVLESSGDTGSK